MVDLLKRAFGERDEESDDEFPLSQTDNVRPRSASADLFRLDVVQKIASKRSIHCRIHGQIELEPILVAVIDTPEFQVSNSLSNLRLCFSVCDL
jgi:hypothetical protein